MKNTPQLKTRDRVYLDVVCKLASKIKGESILYKETSRFIYFSTPGCTERGRILISTFKRLSRELRFPTKERQLARAIANSIKKELNERLLCLLNL